MISVKYSNGSVKEFSRISQSNEAELAIASFRDNFEEVKAIIEQEDNLDLNASVWHSPTRGNGTPLVLTGTKKIAALLIKNGANVNFVYNNGNSKFTALDSALKELEKISTKEANEKLENINELVDFLKENGAKTYDELQKGEN